ncbi:MULTISPECIES: dihydroneopterin aldolase [Acetobacter]
MIRDNMPSPNAASPLGTRPYLKSVLRNVVVNAQVGLHPWELHPERPTRLCVNVEMFAWLTGVKAHDKDLYIDYDPVRNAIIKWPERPHTPLLETLVRELVEVCFGNPLVDALRISITKLDIFNEADGAGIEICGERSELLPEGNVNRKNHDQSRSE